MTEEQTPKRMTSLDRKIEASRLRAEAERKSHAVPQSRPTEGMTSLLSTENCNVANQRKPAHGGRVATEGPGPGFNIVLEPGPVFVVGQGPAAETVAEVIEAAAAGTQPSPEQIKAAIQERERTEAQLRATWEPGQKIGDTTHFRREHLDPASLPPQMGTLLMRIALPPPGSKVAAIGPGGLRFVVERSDKSVYLVMDGPGV